MKYITYTRVSTKDQHHGLVAQERDIDLYLNNYSETPFEVIACFSEMESGKATTNRAEFEKAIALCKEIGATLLVSKLDRLSRSMKVIATLIEDINFKVACLPQADKFQLHLYAALAEQERDFISQRTKAALQVVKAKGIKLGNPNAKAHMKQQQKKAVSVIKKNADNFASKLINIIKPLHEAGKTQQAIAEILNTQGITTARGKVFSQVAVKRILDRV